jgi:hypothetical protein
MKINDLSNDINWYKKALIIFEKNLHQNYTSTTNCLMKLSKLCQDD